MWLGCKRENTDQMLLRAMQMNTSVSGDDVDGGRAQSLALVTGQPSNYAELAIVRL